jgi:hypothetical protein
MRGDLTVVMTAAPFNPVIPCPIRSLSAPIKSLAPPCPYPPPLRTPRTPGCSSSSSQIRRCRWTSAKLPINPDPPSLSFSLWHLCLISAHLPDIFSRSRAFQIEQVDHTRISRSTATPPSSDCERSRKLQDAKLHHCSSLDLFSLS